VGIKNDNQENDMVNRDWGSVLLTVRVVVVDGVSLTIRDGGNYYLLVIVRLREMPLLTKLPPRTLPLPPSEEVSPLLMALFTVILLIYYALPPDRLVLLHCRRLGVVNSRQLRQDACFMRRTLRSEHARQFRHLIPMETGFSLGHGHHCYLYAMFFSL
jgi:hypothetical protein